MNHLRIVMAAAILAVASCGFQAAVEEGLAGTEWELVQIRSMDDSVEVPDDGSRYTLSFQSDRRVAVGADCNRGSGPWTSDGEGQLEFGAIAVTRAMCAPGSLSDTYLAQLAWVRSYVLEDGNLFLATMADGAIIEFEPATGE